MPKAGRYDYPSVAIDSLVERLRKAYELLGPVAKRENLAEAWGLEVRGGGFASLVSAMEIYGLVETGMGEVRITELGKSVAFETDQNLLEQAKARAVRNVELFSDYAIQHGTEVSDERVRTFLRAKGNVDVADLPKIADGIGKLLIKVTPYLGTVIVGGDGASTLAENPSPPSSRVAGGGVKEMTPVKDGKMEFRFDDFYLSGSKTNLDSLQAAYDFLKNKIDALKASTTQTNTLVQSSNTKEEKE